VTHHVGDLGADLGVDGPGAGLEDEAGDGKVGEGDALADEERVVGQMGVEGLEGAELALDAVSVEL
jgi:hypothetical protein